MYSRPIVLTHSDMAEGVYAASGAGTGNNTTTYKCDSIYMRGVYQQPTWSPITDGYKIGRGCEGCPAWNGSSCRFQSAPQEMVNWSGPTDFRPSWEKEGKLPDEKGY